MTHTKINLAIALTGLALMTGTTHAAIVAHYEFEETSGTVLVDSSGNNYDGSVVSSVGGADLNVTGTVGSSAYQPYTGTGDRDANYGVVTQTVATNFGISGNSARTISLWFNTSSFGDQQRLIGYGTGSASQFDIVVENGSNANSGDGNITTENRIGLRYGNGNVFFDADNSGNDFDINTWYHVAVVYDGTTMDLESIGTASDGSGLSFYVNGGLVDTAAGNLGNPTQALTTALADFTFGIDSQKAAFTGEYTGLLDDVQIYNEALSATDVSSLYNNPGTVIPEPSSTALIGLAGLALFLRRRR